MENTPSSLDALNIVGRTLHEKYRIINLIRTGGFGSVYLAEHVVLRDLVAIKFLSSDFSKIPILARQFIDEARAMARLKHPNIVGVRDVYDGFDGIPPHFVMEYMGGGSLLDRLKAGARFSPSETVDFVRKISDALSLAHGLGYVHRDLKPSNFLYDERGEPHLADFGIAKQLNPEGGAEYTGTGFGQIKGSPQYMSPEQALGLTSIDARADQYSLAIVLYQMLSGGKPYLVDDGTSSLQTTARRFGTKPYQSHTEAHISGVPIEIIRWRDDLPAGLSAFFRQALSKTARERYASIEDFSKAFEDAVNRQRGIHTQSPLLLGVGAGLVVIILLIGAFLLLTRPDENVTLTGLSTTTPGTAAGSPTDDQTLIAGVVLLPTREQSATPTSIFEITPTDAPTVTDTPSMTPTETMTVTSGFATLSMTEVELTVSAEYEAILAEIRGTQDAVVTAIAFDQTATADAATDTPTPDTRATAEARVTYDAGMEMTAALAGETATADSWTATPTSTSTSSFTPTLTETVTPSDLPTQTPSRTATSTFTATPAPTDTPRPTQTFTTVPSDTPTLTFTPIPTDTPTPTLTSTPLPTSTPTAIPTETPTSIPTATDMPIGVGTGLLAEYYNNDDLTDLVVVQTDGRINFNWNLASPALNVDPDSFSIRWTGYIEPLYSETYTFYLTSDDGARLWLDGQQVIDEWYSQDASVERRGTIDLIAGQRHEIRVEYFENTGDARIQFRWSSDSQSKQLVPRTALYPAEQPSSTQTPVATSIPLPTSAAFNNGRVTFRDDFAGVSLPEAWARTTGAEIHVRDGQLSFTGPGEWGTSISRAYITEGEAALVLFRYEPGTMEFHLENQEPFDSDLYKRWGVARYNDQWVMTCFGTSACDNITYELEPGEWYYLLLRVSDGGRFQARIWEKNNFDQPILNVRRTPAQSGWDDQEWRYSIQVHDGTLILDSYEELVFPEN